MNRLFGKLFLSFMLIITVLILALMITFTLIYSRSFEEQVIKDNDKQALNIAGSLYSFMHTAYKTVEELSYNSDVLSMDTERQTAVFVSSIERNDYFELLYAQGMDGMQTGRSTGQLGNRKERWWFIQMEQTQRPFISESYYSVGTNMPCASVFFPMYGDNREMIGIMAGDIKLSALHDLVAENADAETGTWAFILDGKGVVVAHPDSTFQEELYNYKTLTRTVTIKDENGIPIQDAAGNLTEEQSFDISDAYKAAIEDMMQGNINSARFEEDGNSIFLSYRPVEMDGYSEPWYVLSVQDGDLAMQTRNAIIFLVIISSAVMVTTALLIVLFAARNISTRVKLEAMEANREIEKAQASERAKSEFLAAMSHEIRTPLNAILGITQIQMHNEKLPDEYCEALDKIYNSGNILLGLINDILDMSKIEAGKLELTEGRYDTASLINDAVQLNIVRLGNKPIEFVPDIDESLPSQLYGDELRLKQILSNLLSNAIKYTSKGRIKLTVSCGEFDEEDPENDGRVCLIFMVEDTGQGMKKEDCERLFTQYQRFNAEANRSTEGTGLGLNITKKIVDMMGGTISVESQYGKGSTFTVTVMQRLIDKTPIGKEIAESFRALTYIDSKYRDRRSTIRNPMPYGSVLVVDDSPSNLYVAAGLLSPYKLKIDTTESGFETLEKIKSGAQYDIIFMDHMMPQMDGIETTKKLRESGYTGTIVALTANALVGNETMFTENGFDGFISKPIDTRRLDKILNMYIRDRHAEQAATGQTGEEQTAQSGRSVQESDNVLDSRLMKIFIDEARRAAGTLKKTLKDGNTELFTTTVHSMKSALANVGESELSQRAAALEKAAQSGDSEFIVANADSFIGDLEAVVDKIKQCRSDTVDNGKSGENTGTDGDRIFLTEQLQIIKDACENYDDAKAFTALDKLAEKQWDRKTENMLEEIRNALFLDSDFERASGIAKENIK